MTLTLRLRNRDIPDFTLPGVREESEERRLTETVELRRVHDEIQPFAEFLKTRTKASVQVRGTRLIIQDLDHPSLKLLVHKFLHRRGLVGFKVHSQPGLIEIVPHDSPKEHDEPKGRSPTAPETMPYFFPGR